MTNHKSTKYMCPKHPDRPGIVTLRDGSTPCWECYLPKEEFERRFGKNFYPQISRIDPDSKEAV